MEKIIFREYDIRGIVGSQFSIAETEAISRAILTYYLKKQPNLETIIVGMDGRTHSPDIKEHVIRVAHEMGINVIDIGVCPTPTFYFAVFNLPAASGIMITASHNPGEYNGFKLCLDRKTVWGKQIKKIANIATTQAFVKRKPSVVPTTLAYDAIDVYTTWLVQHFPTLHRMPLHVLVDCGNGTAGTVYPMLIDKFQWRNVDLLFKRVDGRFPNHEADPTVAHNMLRCRRKMERSGTYNLALGLDGDCDRMAPLTQKGDLISGDELLAIYSQDVIADNPEATIVYDVKSSATLIKTLKKIGAKGKISACGHAIIKHVMQESNALLAGELSCHFFFNDRYFGYDDGIYASLRLLEILLKQNTTLEYLVDQLPKQVSSTEVRLACREDQKKLVVSHVQDAFARRADSDIITIDGVRVQTPYAWGLIRPSNTQAVLSLRFEASSRDGLARIKEEFKQVLYEHFEQTVVKEAIDAA